MVLKVAVSPGLIGGDVDTGTERLPTRSARLFATAPKSARLSPSTATASRSSTCGAATETG